MDVEAALRESDNSLGQLGEPSGGEPSRGGQDELGILTKPRARQGTSTLSTSRSPIGHERGLHLLLGKGDLAKEFELALEGEGGSASRPSSRSWGTIRAMATADRVRALLPVLLLSIAGATGCDAPKSKVIGGGPGFVPESRDAAKGARAPQPAAPASDPRVACPAGTTQQLRRNEFAPKVQIWCEDQDGQRHGPEKEFWNNGKLASEQTYVRGHQDGPERSWYENGQLDTELAYRGGVAEGPFRHWHENGQLAAERRIVSNEAVGIGRWWDARGRLKRTQNYDEPPADEDDSPVALPLAERDGSGAFRFKTGLESWVVRADGAATYRYLDRWEADHRFVVGGEIAELWAGPLGVMHGKEVIVAAVFDRPGAGRSTALERVHPFSLVTAWKTTHPFAIRAPVAFGHSLYASGDGHVVKLDTATGAVVWRKPAPVSRSRRSTCRLARRMAEGPSAVPAPYETVASQGTGIKTTLASSGVKGRP